MKIYPSELQAAKSHWQSRLYPALGAQQLSQIKELARDLDSRVRTNRRRHNLWGLITLAFVLGTDLFLLFKLLPNHFIAATLVHGFWIYSLVIYSMHEGSGHSAIIRVPEDSRGWERKFWSFLSSFTQNLCRIHFADPVNYKAVHPTHHAYLGTERDGAFTQIVHPMRFFKSLLPLAAFLPFNDYKIHSPDKITGSSLLSFLVGTVWNAALLISLHASHQVAWLSTALLLFFVSPWIAFILDRLRETTEHNLMPLDSQQGARDLGIGPWGLIIGGGPWGQPCHLAHHLAPSLPWYGQILLHFRVRKLLNEKQKKFFGVEPWLGFPKLLIHSVRMDIRLISLLSAPGRSSPTKRPG